MVLPDVRLQLFVACQPYVANAATGLGRSTEGLYYILQIDLLHTCCERSVRSLYVSIQCICYSIAASTSVRNASKSYPLKEKCVGKVRIDLLDSNLACAAWWSRVICRRSLPRCEYRLPQSGSWQTCCAFWWGFPVRTLVMYKKLAITYRIVIFFVMSQ